MIILSKLFFGDSKKHIVKTLALQTAKEKKFADMKFMERILRDMEALIKQTEGPQ